MTNPSGNDLFNVRLFQDKQGIHVLLSGSLASDFDTLVESCKRHCCWLACCHGFGSRKSDSDAG